MISFFVSVVSIVKVKLPLPTAVTLGIVFSSKVQLEALPALVTLGIDFSSKVQLDALPAAVTFGIETSSNVQLGAVPFAPLAFDAVVVEFVPLLTP